MTSGATHNHAEGVKLDGNITDRFKAAVRILLERNGFLTGEVTVTFAPDLKFPVAADGRMWIATYSPLMNSVTGATAETSESDLSVRSYLLRLHLARGYPGETNAKLFWAVIVDAMAFTMCFWGLSGLFMWWQIKATRKFGLVILLLSAIAATTLGVSMYSLLSS